MRREKAILAIIVCLTGIVGVSSVHAAGYTWDTDTSGDWTIPDNWSPTGVPYGYGDSAAINRAPEVDVHVSLASGALLNFLSVQTGNNLDITGSLYFGKNAQTAHPVITNNGSINVNGVLRSDGWMGESFELTITGSGSINLYSGGELGSVNAGKVIIDADPTFGTYNTILGGGGQSLPSSVSGWSLEIPLINRGEIYADMGYLRVSKVMNEPTQGNAGPEGGILGAKELGILVLNDFIIDGFIDPGDGIVQLNNANLKNTTICPGVVDVIYISPLWENNTLQPGAQINILPGTRLDLYNSVITNDGIIRIESGGALKNWQSQAVLQGSGKVLLANSGSVLDADGPSAGNLFYNENGHSIEGGGELYAWISNSGTVLANDHTMTVFGSLSGAGKLRIEGQDAFNLAILDYRSSAALTTGSLHINEYGQLLLVNNDNFKLSQDFSFALLDESLWTMADKILNMTGLGDWQALEVGGEDLGHIPSGFTDNFSLGTLHICDNAKVYLTDAIDNGNRNSAEALYVENLIIDPNATLNLNGIVLYTYLVGIEDPVRIDENNYDQYVSFFDGLITSFLQPEPDANGDSEVNLVDFALLAKNWYAQSCTDPGWCEGADMDRSGDIGMSDLRILAEHWLE